MTRKFVSQISPRNRRFRPLRLERLERRDLLSFGAAMIFPAGFEPNSVVVGSFNGDDRPDIATAGPGGINVLLGQAGGSFSPPTVNVTGDSGGIAAADVNLDGHLDLMTANFGSDTASVSLGNGNGTFKLAAHYGAGFRPTGIGAGDFTGDGFPDIAVSTLQGGLAILVNQGDGTFQFTFGYGITASSTSVVVSDFNEDSILDITVAGSNGVRVLLGNGDGSFQSPLNLTGSVAVAAADLNGDGHVDLAVRSTNTTISVIAGNGDGTFKAPKAFPSGPSPMSILAVDTDGDSDLDLAVGNGGVSTMTVMRNQLGSLRRRVTYVVGDSPAAIASGDFNGDTLIDLTTANPGADSVSVILGAGGGAFHALTTFYTIPGATGDVATGDLNGDAKLDLGLGAGGLDVGQIHTLQGNGNGTFTPGQNLATGSLPREMIIQDLGTDGFTDIAIRNETNSAHYSSIVVYPGTASGPLPGVPSYNVGPAPSDVAVGDFNEDGILDLVTPNAVSGGTVSVLLGIGDGSFGASTTYAAGNTPAGVAVSDLDGDGHLDLAVAIEGSATKVGVLLGNGNGSFKSPTLRAAANFATSIIAVDFNGDGIPDLATVGESSNLTILIGLGGATYRPPEHYEVFDPVAVSAGDLNGDGNVDLVVAATRFPNYGVYLLFGNGDGEFTAPASLYIAPGAADVDVADLNGDGNLDIAAGIHEVRISLGNGDGTFSNGTNLSLDPSPKRIAIDDMDGDGDMDIVAANGTVSNSDYGEAFTFFRGNGDATYEGGVSYLAGPDPFYVAVADLDNDGFRDIAGISGDKLYVLLNDDGMTFPAPTHYRVGEGYGLAAGDLNGDGFLDLVTTDVSGNAVVLFNKGNDGLYTGKFKFPVQSRPLDVALSDFNGDGFLDIAAVNEVSDSVSILLGNGDGTFQAAINSPTGNNPTDLVAGDWNGDGNPDLAVLTGPTGALMAVLIGLGNGSFAAPAFYFTNSPDGENLVSADFNADGVPDLAFVGTGVVTVMLGVGNGTFQPAQAYAVIESGTSLVSGDFNADGFADLAVANNDSIAIMINAADWPPLPIWDGPRPSAPLGVDDTAEKLHPTTTQTQESSRSKTNPVSESATTTPRPNYASRHIARVALAETTDSDMDPFSTKLS